MGWKLYSRLRNPAKRILIAPQSFLRGLTPSASVGTVSPGACSIQIHAKDFDWVLVTECVPDKPDLVPHIC